MALATGKLAAQQKAIRTSQLKALEAKFKKLEKKYGADLQPAVMVGYVANYALFVHENLESKHKPGKIAKFLEKPARENRKRYARIMAAALKLGEPAKGAVLLGGVALQRDSMKLVPVDTGNLKAGAFTRPVGVGAGSSIVSRDA